MQTYVFFNYKIEICRNIYKNVKEAFDGFDSVRLFWFLRLSLRPVYAEIRSNTYCFKTRIGQPASALCAPKKRKRKMKHYVCDYYVSYL